MNVKKGGNGTGQQAEDEFIIDFPYKPRFRVSRSKIFYKKRVCPLSSVKHLFYEDIRVNQYVNGVAKTGTANVGRFGVIFDEDKPLVFTVDETGLIHGFNWNKERIIAELRENYLRMLDMTRGVRLSKYAASIANHGYIDYLHGVKFYRDKIVGANGREYLKSQYAFTLVRGVVYARKITGKGFFAQLASLLSDPVFPLSVDLDIIGDVFREHCSSLVSEGGGHPDWVDKYRWSHPPSGRLIV